MNAAPSPFATIRATARGYLPRVFQGRGWVVASLVMVPVALSLIIYTVAHIKGAEGRPYPGEALKVFHEVLVKMMLPIMALVAAPAGIREDLEQRTLPLLLVRPAPAWALPLGKGLPWFAWGAVWLVLGALCLQVLGGDPALLPGRLLGLVGAWWGELALMTLVGLLFKRGTLWGALYFFLWEPLVRIFPPVLQRLTFTHHIESLAGSRATQVQANQLLAQEQVTTHPALALLALFAFGALCWALAGWKLQRTPVGLAGSEAEG
jgi:ABC-type transport system involved in multi-copper enzyme maturation permease subunit